MEQETAATGCTRKIRGTTNDFVWFEFGGGVTTETSGFGFNYVNVFLHWRNTGGSLNEGNAN